MFESLLAIYILLLPILGKIISRQELSFLCITTFAWIIIFIKYKKNTQSISNTTYIYGLILFFCLLISTIFSKNPGDSYYAIVRYICLTAILFISLKTINPDKFLKYSIVFSVLYAAIFWLDKYSLISLPKDTLRDDFIVQTWGHSYLSDFLIISIIPLTRLFSKHNFYYILPVLIINTSTLFFTQSRSALVALFVSAILFKPNDNIQKIIKYLLLFTAIVSISVVFYQIARNQLPQKSLTSERGSYWQQAISGFKSSPIIGNGPNTFYFINQQNRSSINTDTFSAHNFILTSLSDNGIIFTTLFLLGIIIGLRSLNNTYFSISLAVICTALLDSSWASSGILLISLYLIFSGLHLSDNRPKPVGHHPKYLILISIILILPFLSINISDYFLKKSKPIAGIYADPFNLNAYVSYVHSLKDNPEYLTKILIMANMFYPNKISLTSALAETLPPHQGFAYLHKTIDIDRFKNNDSLLVRYLDYFSKSDSIDKFETTFNLTDKLVDKNFKSPDINYQIVASTYRTSVNLWNMGDRDKAIKLLSESLPYANQWSHLYIELANMYWHNDQHSQAISTMETCVTKDIPRKHCLQYLKTKKFIQPGTQFYLDIVKF